jgi:uncharacterized membrane protein (DUF485 family)
VAHNRGKGFWVERNDEWVRTERTSAFQELTRSKKAFIIPATIFFLVFYFGLPFLAAFTTVLNGKAVGSITWAYLYALAQFAMILVGFLRGNCFNVGSRYERIHA